MQAHKLRVHVECAGADNEVIMADAKEGKIVDFAVIRALASTISTRLGLGKLAGVRFNGKRDYYDIFGYEATPSFEMCLLKYQRQDIVSRIIDSPPSGTWSNPPTFEDKEQQAWWSKLQREHNILGALHRADRLARLGPFALLIVGTTKGGLEQPLRSVEQEITYLRPVSFRYIAGMKYDKNPTSPRFGQPESYTIRSRVEAAKNSTVQTSDLSNDIQGADVVVHHSRVIHVVEHALEDDIFGSPIILRIFNLLDDLLKVTGGTAETFWLTANRGMQVDVDREMDLQPEDAAALTEEIDEHIHGLRRFIRTRGVKMNNLGSETPSPKDVFDMIMSLLAGTTGIPKRILMGSEAGQLASEQDRANWAERMEERRLLFAEPTLLHPFIRMMIHIKQFKSDDYNIVWPSAFIMSPLEDAQVMSQKGRAIGTISKQTGNMTPMQVTSVPEARKIIGLEGDLAESDILKIEPPKVPAKGGAGETDPIPADDNPTQ